MMSTAIAPSPAPPAQRLVLDAVEWKTYQALLDLFEGRHLRLNYDRGRLEIMVTGSPNERWKKLIGRLLEIAALEFDVSMLGQGNFTLRRQDLDRGLEVDDCWNIAHEAEIRGRDQIDLDVDPPPDLVVEIEVSHGLIERLPLLAALGVPEIWRYDGSRLSVLVLSADGRYVESEISPTFPTLPLSGFAEHLEQVHHVEHSKLLRSFQTWVRQFRPV